MEDEDQSNNKSQDQETQDDYLQFQDSQELQSVAGKHDHLTDEERAAAVGHQVDDEKNEERKDDAQNVQRTENKYTKLKELILVQKDMKPEIADLATALKDNTKYDIVIDDTKQRLNTIFLGHVDSGKTTICGSISGQTEECKIDGLKQESRQNSRALWWGDYLVDIDRCHIVNPTKPKFETDKKILTILDSPGFKNYSNVLNNSRVEIACLVISARLGEFEAGFEKGGQTTQHALLAKCIGAQDIIVLINKMDEKQINWSQERYDYIKEKLTPFLRDSCGYDLEKNVYWLPISAQSGDNMMTGIKDPRGSWYTGPTFFQLLDDLPVSERDPEGPVRIPVLDKFNDGGKLNVFGKVASGTITHGMSLTVVPSGELLTIDTIYNDADLRIPYAKPGENIRLIIKEDHEQSISSGDVICSNYNFIYACTEMECEINILNLPQHKYIIAPGYTCTLFIHTAIVEVTITAIKATLAQTVAKPKPAKFLKSGSVGIVRIARTDNNAICCDKFEKSSYLGGFTLRDDGALIAFGKVLRVKPV